MVLITKKRTTPLKHRKRTGQHHKRDKSYEKHYWPYLPLLALAGVGFVFNIFWAPISQAVIPNSVLSYATNTSLDSLLTATNVQRTDNSQSQLTLNNQLIAAAQAKANDMASRNYWSHNTPDGIEPWWFVNTAGYAYQAVGENLAYGFDNSAATVIGWMNSPGHRANILNANYQEVGFGIANNTNYQNNGPQTIVVAMYGKPLNGVASATTPPAAPTPKAVAAAPTPTPAAPSATPVPAEQPSAPAITPSTPTALPTPTREQIVTTSPSGQPVTIPAEPQTISRLQLVTQDVPVWSVAVTTIIVMAAAAIFIFRHMRYLHRILVKGEHYVIKHPSIDIIVVLLIVIGVLLTRSAGNIH